MREIEERRGSDGQWTGGGVNGIALLVGGIGLGALLMYFFDPDRGRGRRARCSDQLTSTVNRLGESAGAKARHLRNRAKGLLHEAGSLLPGGGSSGASRQDGEGTNQEAPGAAGQGA